MPAYVVGGGSIGWISNGWRWEARYAALEKAQAEKETELVLAVSAARESAIAAIERGEALAAEVNAGEAERIKLARERDDAIRKNTTGRACLDAGVVGLLNHGAAAAGSGLRPPSGDAPGATAGIATDTDVRHQESGIRNQWATDTDVALWAGFARDQYETCRGRIDALRQFFQQESGTLSDP
ncbi:MAG: hypothetical protein LBC37_01285 [Zoogloeaceae bacterium]|jgi:hypothetical protein|nr:hypothetical protein [Zoogloeaceae bacterium]